MKLTPRTNQYGHEVVDCPFCPDFIYLREETKGSPDALRDLKRHITSQARAEALEKCVGNIGEFKHLMYYVEHTTPAVVKIVNKRQFDGDLSI